MPGEDYPYPLLDEKGKLVCQLCGKSFLVISPKHLANHDIRYSEYKLRFPDAPLSTSEFAASSRYGRVKNIFDDEVLVEDEIDIEDEFEGMEDPEIEEELEIDIEKLSNTIRTYKDPMQERKLKILDHLRTFFSNVQQDYMVQLTDGGGFLKSEFITDFADTVLKIDIEFPDVFWHNEGIIDLSRDNKMKDYGWKVIRISGNSPSTGKISECISEQL
jgi:hypothetical protein